MISALAASVALCAEPAFSPRRMPRDRDALIAHIRAIGLETDLVGLARRLCSDLGAPHWLRHRVQALLGRHDHRRGFQSIRALAEDEAFGREAAAFVEAAAADPSVWLAGFLLAQGLPDSAWGREALRDRFYTHAFGLDIDAVRETVAALPRDGLLVVFGAPLRPDDTGLMLVREPFRRYLELVHGRRSIEWLASHPDRDGDALVELLIDPAIRVVAFVTHGAWSALDLSGTAVDPEVLFQRLCDGLRDDPLGLTPASLGLNQRHEGALQEEDLASRLAGRTFAPKDLVVRHCCGADRYRADIEALAEAPPHLRERIVTWRGLSGSRPGSDGTWEEELLAWMGDRRLVGREYPAFGTCLVADPRDTRGYTGLAWFPDYVADPIPAYSPPFPWPS